MNTKVNLHFLYDQFFSLYPIYQKFYSIDSFQELHDWLWDTGSVAKMLDALKFKRPAIEGIVSDIESIFENRDDLSFRDNYTKKATGMLIKYVLEYFGYISARQKDIGKGMHARYFTSGMYYEFDESREVYRLVTTFSIVAVNDMSK
jgi:hypothetical protein